MTDGVDFIGIGMVKSGTTWVSRCLSRHPQVLFSGQRTAKEIKFFDRPYNLAKGYEWYLRQFPPAEAGKKRGEFTPTYLVDTAAHLHLKHYCPGARLLVSLRNPCDMLYSLHRDAAFSPWGSTVADFGAAVMTGNFHDINGHYGLYHTHLVRFYSAFPRDAVLVTLYDDIQSNPEATLAKIYAFVGVDASYVPAGLRRRVNPTVAPRCVTLHWIVKAVCASVRRSGPVVAMDHSPKANTAMSLVKRLYKVLNGTSRDPVPLRAEVRARLVEHYRDEMEKLQELIRRDLSAWQT